MEGGWLGMEISITQSDIKSASSCSCRVAGMCALCREIWKLKTIVMTYPAYISRAVINRILVFLIHESVIIPTIHPSPYIKTFEITDTIPILQDKIQKKRRS